MSEILSKEQLAMEKLRRKQYLELHAKLDGKIKHNPAPYVYQVSIGEVLSKVFFAIVNFIACSWFLYGSFLCAREVYRLWTI